MERPPHELSEQELEAPWERLEDERPDEVLALLRGYAREGRPHPEAAALACLAHGDLGELEAAARALGPERGDASPAWWLARAELALLRWDPEGARPCLERLEADAPSVEARLRLALVADLLGDERDARRWRRRAAELHPDGPDVFPELAPEAFDAVVAEAAAALPEAFARRLDGVPVLVDPVPSRELAGPDVPPDTLGLFRGASDLDGSFEGDADLPPAIHLFQNNLERRSRDVAELREEIRVTLYHELGHLLGFDEEGVDALGLH